MGFDVAAAALWIVPLLSAVVLHEWAHGYVAFRLGDDTAAVAGRLTLNPLAHIDPVGTVLIPAMLLLMGAPMFGYAKPVPVSWGRLGNPMRDMVWVAAAGPAMNLALALVSAMAFGLLRGAGGHDGFQVAEPLAVMCWYSIHLNVLLAVLNLLPIPPLDGGRVATGLLPPDAARTLAGLEPYGFPIVIGLLVTGVLDAIMTPIRTLLLGVLTIFM